MAFFNSSLRGRGDRRQRGSAGVEEFEDARVKLPLLRLELRQVLPGHRPAAEGVGLDGIGLNSRDRNPAGVPIVNGRQAIELVNGVSNAGGLDYQRRLEIGNVRQSPPLYKGGRTARIDRRQAVVVAVLQRPH